MASTAALSAHSRSQSPTLVAPIVLFGRLLFALIFLMAGPNHFASQTIVYAASRVFRWLPLPCRFQVSSPF